MFMDIMNIRVWTVAVGEELCYERETPHNPTDLYAVVVKKDGITVSHLPRKIQGYIYYF